MEHAITHTFATYYDLYIPEGAEGPLPLLIATHGYSGKKSSMMRLAKKVDADSFVIASLQGPHQHFKRLGSPENIKQDIGFGWLTPWKPEESKNLHHDSVTAIIDQLAENGTIDAENVFCLGFSQSVSLNLRYALTFPGRIRGHISICGGVPFDLLENPIYHSDCVDALYIHMDQDEFYPPEKAQDNCDRLRKVARTVDFEMLEGSHTISPPMFPIIAQWIKSHLS